MTQNTDECYSRDALKNYLQGWSGQHDAALIEHHLASCTLCEASISTLEAEIQPLLEAPSSSDSFIESPSNQQVIDTAILAAQQINAAQPISPAQQINAEHQNATDAPPTVAALAAPVSHLGPYTILGHLGSGGMGSVYLARHQSLNKQVAIKLLPGHAFHNQHFVARFRREIRAIGQLNHPSIVSATDAGESEGVHYLVMEHIDGLDLSRLARAAGPLRIEDAAAIMTRVALGLSYAHANGIVHRDVKPSNIMVRSDGEVKILDFGLAHTALWDEVTAQLTTVGQLMGTLDYMAPEQADNPDAIDYRADLYSLGATLYRMLTGRPPLVSAPNLSPLAKLRLIATAEPPSLSVLRPDAPASLVELVTSLLARDPNDRPASAAHVAELLQAHCPGANLSKLVANSLQSDSLQADSSSYTVPPNIVPQAAVSSSKSGGGWRSVGRWVAAMFIPLAALAAGMIVLETQKGKLVIQSKDANVTVRVLKDHKLYETLQVVPGGKTTKLYAGTYEIEIDGPSDRYALNKNQVLIQNGETVIATIDDVATNPAPSDQLASDNSSTNTNEATYQGKPLSYWLHLYDIERDPKELGNVLSALRALVAPSNGNQIAEHLIHSLPIRGDQEVTRTDGNNWSDLDTNTFGIIGKCFKNPDQYIALIHDALKEADDEWATRILRNSFSYTTLEISEQQSKPLRDYALSKLNEATASDELTTMCAYVVESGATKKNFKPETTQSLIQALRDCKRLGNKFWLRRIGSADLLKEYNPAYIAIVEEKAIDAALSPETSNEYFSVAVGILTNFANANVLDRNRYPLARQDQLKDSLKRKLDTLLETKDQLLQFQNLARLTDDDAHIFSPKLNHSFAEGSSDSKWPGIQSLSTDVDYNQTTRTKRANAGLVILSWFDALNLENDIQSELLKLAVMTARDELECSLLLAPKLFDNQSASVNWSKLSAGIAPLPMTSQWASYFLYWKALDLLPEDQQRQAMQLRRNELFRRYYPAYLALRDENADDRLTPAEMLQPRTLPRFLAEHDADSKNTPIDANTPLSEDDVVAAMLQHKDWLTPWSFRTTGRSNTPASNVAETSKANEPTYQSKPLSHWLHLYDVERDPKELGNVVSAIKALITPETRHQIADHLFGSLPQRGNQDVVLTKHGMRNANGESMEGDTTSSLDAQSFVIIRNCFKDDDFATALQLALSKADDTWASRILENRFRYGLSELNENLRQPILDYAIAKLNAGTAADRLIRACANLLTTELASKDSKPDTAQTLTGTLRDCKRLENEFWLKSIDDIESLKRHGPAYVALVEEKAVNAALSPQTTTDYFFASMAIIATIHQSAVLDRTAHPLPHRDELVALYKQKLADQLASRDRLLQFKLLSYELQDSSQFFIPKLKSIREFNGEPYWPGIGILTYSMQPIRSNVAFNLFDWFVAMGMKSEIEPLLPAFLEATSELELQCYLKLEPSIAGRNSQSGWPNRTITWPSLSIENRGNGRNVSATENPTDAQWVAYFIYWKASDLLPEDQRKAATASRQEKLFRTYYTEYLSLRDKNNDGRLSVSEMASRTQLERMQASDPVSANDKPVDFDAALSEDDAIAFLLKHPSLLNNVLAVRPYDEETSRPFPFANGGRTAPNRSQPPNIQASETKSDEPTYQGKTLSYWLHLFDVERDQQELNNVIRAISTLATPKTNAQIANHLIDSLSKRPKQQIQESMGPGVPPHISDLDRATFEIIHSCSPTLAEYVALIDAALKKADDDWASRILEQQYVFLRSQSDEKPLQPLLDFAVRKLNADNTSKALDAQSANFLVSMVDVNNFSDRANQAALEAVRNCKRLGNSFWLSKVENLETLKKQKPLYISIVEEKAIDAALSPETSPEYFSAAVGIAANIAKSGVLNREEYPIPKRDALKESLKRKLQELLANKESLFQFQLLESTTNDEAFIFFPKLDHLRESETGYPAWPGIDGTNVEQINGFMVQRTNGFDGEARRESRKPRTTPALIILTWFDSANLSGDIQAELQKLVGASTENELDCFLRLEPSVRSRLRSSLNFATLEIINGLPESVRNRLTQAAETEWAGYFLYWKSLDLLPEAQRDELIKLRREKLYRRYYPSLLRLRDENSDGRLSLSEMLTPQLLQQYRESQQASSPNSAFDADAPLTEDAAVAIMLEHQDWLRNDPTSAAVLRSLPPGSPNPSRRGASNRPQASPTNPASPSELTNEPIYQGKPLSHWLHLFELEYDPTALTGVVDAIKALINPNTGTQIANQLITSLPKRSNLSIRKRVKDEIIDVSLDRETFQIIRKCLTNPSDTKANDGKANEYGQLIIDTLAKADDKWAIRMFDAGALDTDEPLNQQQGKVLNDFFISKIDDPSKSEAFAGRCASRLVHLANRKDVSPEAAQSFLDALNAAKRLGNSYWLEYIADNDAMQSYKPAYLVLLQRKAVEAALSPASTPEQFCAAIGIITNIRKSGKLDPQKYELPHLAQLKNDLISRLRRLTDSPQELLKFYSLESVSIDSAGIFFPVPARAWPGIFVQTFSSTKQRVNTALAILNLFESLDSILEIEPEIERLVSGTSEGELECSWTLNPSILPVNNLWFDWSTFKMTRHTDVQVGTTLTHKVESFSNEVSEPQWAAFFIYWKAVNLLPEQKRTALTQARMTKLAQRYYPDYLKLRDENEDGHLSLSEMLRPDHITDQQKAELKTLDSKPIEQDQPLSQDDAIAIMSQHADWLTFVRKSDRPKRSQNSTNEQPTESNPQPFKPKPIYQGKALSHWLQLFSIERDPKELGNVTEAIEALVADDTKSTIRDELLKRLPNRPNQTVVLEVVPKETYLDIKALHIVERCSQSQQEYVALIAKLYREADPKWSTRILLGSGFDQDTWNLQEKDAQPTIDFCMSVLEAPTRSKSDVQYSQQVILNFANQRGYSDQINQKLTDFMIKSSQFDQTFWFERSAMPHGLVGLDPRFLVAIERKAVDTVLAPETTPQYFSVALAFMIEIRTLDWVDLNRFEIPHREQLQQRLAQRLKEFAKSPQERHQFHTLSNGTKNALGLNTPNRRSPFEPSQLTNISNFLKNNNVWPGGLRVQPSYDSDIRELQVLTVLNYYESMKMANNVQTELESLIESTSDGELACFHLISPDISTLAPGKLLIWRDMRVKDTKAESPTFVSGSTPEQWADYFTYWKAIDLLPQAKRLEILKKRNNKLYAKYWAERVASRDFDKDGRLLLDDLMGPMSIERMKSANELVVKGQTIAPKTPLDESTAIELLKKQSHPYFFGVGE